MSFLRSFYIHSNFFIYVSVLSACFMLSFWVPFLYAIAWLATIGLGLLLLLDLYLLYILKSRVEAHRLTPQKLSNSDDNILSIRLQSLAPYLVHVVVIDELPEQFQKRDFEYKTILKPHTKQTFEYTVKPVDRGVYVFGNLNVYVSSPLRILKKRYTFQNQQNVPVYPSIIQMQQYDFLATSNRLSSIGLKKIRRIGHTQEFEQIKDYILGDDYRNVNWKATAKKNQLMVNQFQDEKSQPIYSVIDTGRVMKMPFEGLKLLDYAINTSLAFSNVALKRKDKTGLITFSKQVDTFLPALAQRSHLNMILEQLYRVDTRFTDSDYGALYTQIKRNINHRSLLILYTNFEHKSALQRQLPYLKAIAKNHVLVVVFFENSELTALINTPSQNIQEIYHQTIAEKFYLEKKWMQKELQKHGIQTILTQPQQLTIKTINKYLEIKSRGMI